MECMTTSGEAIKASVETPSSADAVFVPFLKTRKLIKTTLTKRNNNKMSKSTFESFKNGNSDAVRSAILASLSESGISEKINNIKSLLECKKNKEEFKKLMAEKLAAKNAGKPAEQDPGKKNEKPAVKKLSLKDRIAQRKAGKKVTESAKCCECGKDSCKEANGKNYCEDCFKKVNMINEGIQRLLRGKKINESIKNSKSNFLGKNINESRDFSRELAIVKAARDRHRGNPIKESYTNESGNCDQVMIGIVFPMEKLDDAAHKTEKKRLVLLSEIKKIVIEKFPEFTFMEDPETERSCFGKIITHDTSVSINDVVKIADSYSAAFFEELKNLGFDIDGISTNCSTMVITD